MDKKFTYKNETIDKKQLRKIILWAFTNYGITTVSNLVDTLKTLGFYYATQAGLSLSLEDLKIPPEKAQTLKKAYESTNIFNANVERAELTEIERFQQVINTWNQTSEDLKNQVIDYFKKTDPLNSIYIMAFSGARGNISQVRQLVGMRGLMADPNGEIIDLPITANFREGLKITDYLISSFGARKGLVDTALKTADSGYLTRRLVDVAQDIIIREMDCGTKRGIHVRVTNSNLINEQLIGRILAEDLILEQELLLKKGEELSFEVADKLIKHIPFDIYVYSSLTCMSVRSICQKCYGWNLATNKLVQLGEAVGVLAAQSIGEPGTQLTMRTFHTGGVFTGSFSNQIRAQASGQVIFSKQLKLIPFRTDLGKKAYLTQNSGEIYLKTYKNEFLSTSISSDTILFIDNYSYVKGNFLIGELSIKKESKAIATKELKAPNSGEIYLDTKYFSTTTKQENDSSGILWLFSGNLYKIPFSSFLNLEKNQKTLKNQPFLQTKITSTLTGTVQFSSVDQNSFETKLKIKSKNFHLNLLNFYKVNSNLLSNYKYYFQFFDLEFNLSLFITSNFSSNQTIGENFLHQKSLLWDQEKLVYLQNQMGSKYKNLLPLSISKPSPLNNGILLTLPSLNKNQFSSSIKFKKKQIVIVDFCQKQIYRTNLAQLNIKQLESLTKQKNIILYPGESLIEDYSILTPSLMTKIVKNDALIFFVRPLEFYRLPKYEERFNDLNLNLTLVKQFKPLLKRRNNKKLLSFELIAENKDVNFLFPNTDQIFGNLSFMQNKDNKIEIYYGKEEVINLANYENSTSEEEKLKLNLIVKSNETVSKGSLLGYYELLSSSNLIVKNYKLRHDENLYLFVTTENDYYKIFTETSNFNLKKGDFLFKNNKLNNSLLSGISGQVEEVNGSSLVVRKAYPSLFSKGTFLFVANEDFVYKNKTLGLFLFEKTTTGDIVQGLPKVEEILEARKISSKGRLSKDFGLFLYNLPYFVTLRQTQQTLTNDKRKVVKFFQVLLLTKNGIRVYRRLQNNTKNLEKGDFINLNYPILNGMNLHKLLYNYYKYFSSFNSIYETCYRSLRKIQVLIVSSIQQVYESQGVSISDKHIELIVRQMSSKVQVANQGKTALRCGDIVDLENVRYVNESLHHFKEPIAAYVPVLNGITRASLKTESFISAASFQETTKVLTESAIEGKMDWLRGLKENVIVGRLIPAGTGFNVYNSLATKKNISLPFSVKN
jgi:DNA-directed RNA polymerase subunit beta'